MGIFPFWYLCHWIYLRVFNGKPVFYKLLMEWIPIINPDWLRFFPEHPGTSIIVGIVFGIISLLLAKKVYQILLFLAVLMGCLYLFYADPNQREYLYKLFEWLGILQPITNTVGELWPAILAILIALVFLYFQKHVVVTLTACIGSYMIADIIAPILFLPLCFIGILLQLTKTPRSPKKEAEE
jgi:hypothetical protein